MSSQEKKCRWSLWQVTLVAIFTLFGLKASALSLDELTQGKSFAPWLLRDQILLTANAGFDQSGLEFLVGSSLATVLARQGDADARAIMQRQRALDVSLSKIGSSLGSGFPGIAAVLLQLWLDPGEGLLHGRSLLLTSLNHIALALVVQRERPGQDERVSFPSGHVASAFASASSLAFSYGPWVGGPAFLAAAMVMGARLSDDVHWLSDCVAGAAIGIYWARASAHVRVMEQLNGPRVSSSIEFVPLIIPNHTGLAFRARF